MLSLRLSKTALDSHERRLVSSGVESANHSINMVDPKNVICPVVGKALQHAAVHGLNNGRDESIKLKLADGQCELPSGSPAEKVYKRYGHSTRYNRQYRKLPKSIKRRNEINRYKLKQWMKRRQTKFNTSDYGKYQKDKATATFNKWKRARQELETSLPSLEIPCSVEKWKITKTRGRPSRNNTLISRKTRLSMIDNKLKKCKEELTTATQFVEELEKKSEDDHRQRNEKRWKEEVRVDNARKHFYTSSNNPITVRQTRVDHSYQIIPSPTSATHLEEQLELKQQPVSEQMKVPGAGIPQQNNQTGQSRVGTLWVSFK